MVIHKLNNLKFDEEENRDRMSALPDCLLIEILSCLPYTKYAIRTGTLSKRWQHLWTYVYKLNFNIYKSIRSPVSDFYSLVDKTLTQCNPNSALNEFGMITGYNFQFNSQVNNWIRYAVNRNVRVFNIDLRQSYDPYEAKFEFLFRFVFDEFFFINSCFTHLSLEGYHTIHLNPTGAISWKKLKTLHLTHLKLEEDLIENILSGSPSLETLELERCYGYRRLDITSKSVKNLKFIGYDEDPRAVVEINAPYILSLTIESFFELWKLLLLDVSSLVKAKLCYIWIACCETSKHAEKEEALKGFILNLRHVKELQIGKRCLEVVSRLEAKGFIFPSNIVFLSCFMKRREENLKDYVVASPL